MENLAIATDIAFQGDIFIARVDTLPADAVPVTKPLDGTDREAFGYHPQKGLVLAQGESRQHYHAFRDVQNVKMFSANDNKHLFVVVENQPCVLQHEEHNPIQFAPGVYRFGFQQEETFEGEYRRVAD